MDMTPSSAAKLVFGLLVFGFDAYVAIYNLFLGFIFVILSVLVVSAAVTNYSTSGRGYRASEEWRDNYTGSGNSSTVSRNTRSNDDSRSTRGPEPFSSRTFFENFQANASVPTDSSSSYNFSQNRDFGNKDNSSS